MAFSENIRAITLTTADNIRIFKSSRRGQHKTMKGKAMITIHGQKETKYKVQRIKRDSDFAPFREWRTVEHSMTKDEAQQYCDRMKNSDDCEWRWIVQ